MNIYPIQGNWRNKNGRNCCRKYKINKKGFERRNGKNS